MKAERKQRTPGPEGAPFHMRGRVWMEGPEGTFLGYGRVVLLESIRDHGSISAAARHMKMSYRHAWKLVDSMNRQSPDPLVTRTTGGRGGGGAQLTETGARAIETFWRVYKEYKTFLAMQNKQLGW